MRLGITTFVFCGLYFLSSGRYGESFSRSTATCSPPWTKRGGGLRATVETNNKDMKDILALDFDGVMCHSSPESSTSAIMAVRELWDYSVSGMEEEQVMKALMNLRPVVETGYENMILARMAIDEIRLTGEFDTEMIKQVWGVDMRDSLIQKFESDRETLIAAFGSTRDKFIG